MRHAEVQAGGALSAVESEKTRIEHDKLSARENAKLLLHFAGGMSTGDSGEMKLENAVGTALGLTISVLPPGNASIAPADLLERGGAGVIRYSDIASYPAISEVHYTDTVGEKRIAELVVNQQGRFQQRGVGA